MSTTLIRRLLGRRPEREADAELAGYLDLLAEDYEGRGMTPDEARRAAISAVGDLEPARSEIIATDTRQHRRDRIIAWLDTVRQDVRFAGRMFAREKNWTAVAVLTLALAIGPTSALFSIVNAVLLRPLPFREPDDIVSITISGGNDSRPPLAMFDAWKARSRGFSARCDGAVRPLEISSSSTAARNKQGIVETASRDAQRWSAGEPFILSFEATKNAEGNVSGRYHVDPKAADARFDVSVTCLSVVGNRAWVGVMENSDDPIVRDGLASYFYVVDNGEGRERRGRRP